MLGLFENDANYEKFITQGAKKYAIEKEGKIEITVAGVPKKGFKALHKIEDFKDNLIFKYKDTGKNLLVYCENQEEFELVDYQNHKTLIKDKSGCALLPCTYTLGKSNEYVNLITENSSERAKFIE